MNEKIETQSWRKQRAHYFRQILRIARKNYKLGNFAATCDEMTDCVLVLNASCFQSKSSNKRVKRDDAPYSRTSDLEFLALQIALISKIASESYIAHTHDQSQNKTKRRRSEGQSTVLSSALVGGSMIGRYRGGSSISLSVGGQAPLRRQYLIECLYPLWYRVRRNGTTIRLREEVLTNPERVDYRRSWEYSEVASHEVGINSHECPTIVFYEI